MEDKMPWILDPSVIAIAISIASLGASFLAYRASIHHHSDSETSDLIKEHYNDMFRLHELRAEYPLQSHLFELNEQYEIAKASVAAAIKNESLERKSLYLLEERAMARRIFSMYESNYYQWKNAGSLGGRFRLGFLKDVLDYCTTRLLSNPRLVWYWSLDGGGLSVHYERETVEYYENKVVTRSSDGVGPFA